MNSWPAWMDRPGLLAAALLIAARLGGMFLLAPFFGERGLFARARVALMPCLTLVLAGAWIEQPGSSGILDELGRLELASLAVMGLGELLIGLTMGLCARLILAGVSTAGNLIAFHAGLTMVNSLDPNFETQPLLEVFVSMLVLMLLLGLDVHHGMLRVLAASLTALPPGAFHGLGVESLLAAGRLFSVGLSLASPILLILLLVEVAMGVVQKVATELQLLVMLLPFRFGLALLLLGLCMLSWKGPLTELAKESARSMERLVLELAGQGHG